MEITQRNVFIEGYLNSNILHYIICLNNDIYYLLCIGQYLVKEYVYYYHNDEEQLTICLHFVQLASTVLFGPYKTTYCVEIVRSSHCLDWWLVKCLAFLDVNEMLSSLDFVDCNTTLLEKSLGSGRHAISVKYIISYYSIYMYG